MGHIPKHQCCLLGKKQWQTTKMQRHLSNDTNGWFLTYHKNNEKGPTMFCRPLYSQTIWELLITSYFTIIVLLTLLPPAMRV